MWFLQTLLLYAARFLRGDIGKQRRKAIIISRRLPGDGTLRSTKWRFDPLLYICRFAAVLQCFAGLVDPPLFLYHLRFGNVLAITTAWLRGGAANLFSSITQPAPAVPGFRPDTRKPGHQPDAADVPVVSVFCCNPVNGELRGQTVLLALAQHDALYRFHQIHGVGTVDEGHTLAIHRGQAEGTVIAGDLDGDSG